VAAAALVLQQVGEWLIGSDAVRLGIVYVHLMACCVAIGVVFTSDIAFVAQLLKGNPYARQDPEHLRALQSTVTLALSALWLTGMAIVVLDASGSGWSYYLNPKLQAKVVIVCLLTLNGLLLHNAVLPAIVKTGNLLKLSISRRLLAIFAGSVSGVSWGYAAMLGIARPLNWRYSLEELLAMYPVFIAAGFLAMLLLTFWARYRGRRAQPRVRVEPSGNRGFTRA
jgi:hypothetical protein